MKFNPIDHKGISLEDQVMNWSRLNTRPYDKTKVDPYTRTRGILMNSIEVESILFSHQFARHTSDMETKRKLAAVRRIEQQQQKAINWSIPAEETDLEVTLGYEQVAVDLTAFLARNEPDPYVKSALNFALLEDFDHLYRYSNLYQLTEEKSASDIIGDYTEITVGRPTVLEHRHPADDVRRHYAKKTARFVTKLHVMTIIAAEQQTMNFYMNIGDRAEEELARGLYLEIGQVEEQHVTHYESLMDPSMSWLERLLLHEYNECWLYYSLLQNEPDRRVKQLWEKHLDMEIGHLHLAINLMKEHEKRDPLELLPDEMPPIFKFESNVDYVRQILQSQAGFNAFGTEFVSADNIPSDYRYHNHQKKVNAGGAPSEMVIEKIMDEHGNDYRQELAGPHPVEKYRQRQAAAVH